MLNPDYKDMLLALSEEKADFLIVGAYALAVYGLPRATGDIDLFVGSDPGNSKKVYRALVKFGAPLTDLDPESFSQEGVIFQMGVVPNRIDLLSSISGVSFAQAWAHRQEMEVEGLKLAILSLEDLILNKTASGRPKDIADLDWLHKRRDKK